MSKTQRATQEWYDDLSSPGRWLLESHRPSALHPLSRRRLPSIPLQMLQFLHNSGTSASEVRSLTVFSGVASTKTYSGYS